MLVSIKQRAQSLDLPLVQLAELLCRIDFVLNVQEVGEWRVFLEDLVVEKFDQICAFELRGELEDQLLIQPLEEIVELLPVHLQWR